MYFCKKKTKVIEIIDIPRDSISYKTASDWRTENMMHNIKYARVWCLIKLVGLHKLTVSGMEVQKVSLVKTLARNIAWWCHRLDRSFGKFNLAKISFLLLVDPLIRYLLYYNSTNNNNNNNNNTNTNSDPCSVFGRWAVRFESYNGLELSVINLVILRFVATSICKRMQILSASISSLWGFQFLFVKGKWKCFPFCLGIAPWR
jgi:hypothetical protein